MVFNLEHIQYVEDKNLLSGHLMVLLGQDYQAAQVELPDNAYASAQACLGFKQLHNIAAALTGCTIKTSALHNEQWSCQACCVLARLCSLMQLCH